MRIQCIGILFVLFLMSCHSPRLAKTAQADQTDSTIVKRRLPNRSVAKISSPPVFIYKTRGDYANLVPVIMNAEKTEIVSYPHPSDVYYKGRLAKPTPLNQGYFLDNRGISTNVVFTSYTYEEYSKLATSPTKEELIAHIIDKNPLTDWVNCGYRIDYKNIVEELNAKIDAGIYKKRVR